MCGKEFDNITINSLPIKCAIRKGSLKHLRIRNDNIFEEKNYLENGDQYNIDIRGAFRISYLTTAKLKYIFFSTTFDDSKFKLNSFWKSISVKNCKGNHLFILKFLQLLYHECSAFMVWMVIRSSQTSNKVIIP